MDEDEIPGSVVVEIQLSKYLDTSLIDVDAHPTYVTVVIKNKTLRLRFPEEVHSDAGKAQRSKVTGALRLIFPKVDERSVQRSLRVKQHMEEEEAARQAAALAEQERSRVKKKGELILEAVRIKGIVKQDVEEPSTSMMKAVKSRKTGETNWTNPEADDDDECPALY